MTQNSSLAEQNFIPSAALRAGPHPSSFILYSTVVKLIATQTGSVPATQGRLAHGAFLDIVKTIDPDLSQTIHNLNGRKPFTVSPLRKLGRPHQGRIPIRAGHNAELRFTLLDAQLFTTLTQYLLNPPPPTKGRAGEGAGPTIRIGDVSFAVTEMLTTPGSHPWAGYTTIEALSQKWQSTELESAHRNLAIKFASPTVFSFGTDDMGKHMEPFPTPPIFFKALASRWKAHLPAGITPELVQQYAEETVVVGLYQMQSKMYRFWKQPQIGAEGTVTYILRDKAHPQMTRLFNLLVDLGFYSGIGFKTAMGMGQICRMYGDD